MIPLIFTSLWMWALIVERLLYFRQIAKDDIDLKQAIEMLSDKTLPPTSMGLRTRVVTSFLKERSGNKKMDQSILDQYAMRERPYIRRFLS
ncbi:MAG: hypothetical protein IMF11_21750, partial [Proteobacteria bacterium]|nr:hypothetical protein [Pseudomonadota bacterium]